MALELRDLEVFLTVVSQGSFGRAANELRLSQPAVSERVRHLERVVGAPVFDRTTRGATLTTTGEQLLPYAQRCTTVAREALEVVQRDLLFPRFVIAVHSSFAPRVVPVVLGALSNTPRRVAVRDAHSHEVEALVLDGVADVGFAIPGGARRGLRRVPLAPDAVTCVVAPDHALARARQPSLDALTDTVLAVNAWGDGSEAFSSALQARGVDEWRVRHCGDAATAVALAREHGHVAFVTASTAAPDLQAKRLQRVAIAGMPRWSVRLDLVYRTADHDDATIELIRRRLP